MVWLLVAALMLGILLVVFGLMCAMGDAEGDGREFWFVVAGLVLIVGVMLRFGWVAWHALARMI